MAPAAVTLEGFTGGQLAALAGLVFLAGVVDALAGGGGLITLPAYLAIGLDPLLVLGTNKLSSCIGTVASVLNYRRGRGVPLGTLAPAVAAALVGGVAGAAAATRLSAAGVRLLMLVALPALCAFLLTRRAFGERDESARYSAAQLRRREAALSLPIGAYDGFFGPGTGTFFALALARACRYDLLDATARAKALNLSTNAAALAAFLWAGRVHVRLGLAMGAASLCGHYAGSHLGLRGGAKLIRAVVAAVCALLFLKLLAGAELVIDPAELRIALVGELRATPGDDVGWEAGEFLLTSTVALVVDHTGEGHEGRAAAALYDPDRRAIVLDRSFVESAGSGRPLETLARRVAPTLVHEIEHARLLEQAPGAPAMREGEVAAYAAEAVFLRRRLEREPSYGELAAVDKDARRREGWPAAKGDWWREPFPEGAGKKLIGAALPGRGLYWFNARAAAGGLETLVRAYDEAGLLGRLPPAAKACSPALPVPRRKACGKAADLLRARVERLGVLLP